MIQMHACPINPLSVCIAIYAHTCARTTMCVLVWDFLQIQQSDPLEHEVAGWLGLCTWWCDSAGAEQAQSVLLHLWPFCSSTTWPLTVFRCYMTRISEVYTEVNVAVGMFMKRLQNKSRLVPQATWLLNSGMCVVVAKTERILLRLWFMHDTVLMREKNAVTSQH